jgi:hypothetical protein
MSRRSSTGSPPAASKCGSAKDGGVDALLGEVTRPHDDLDLVIARGDCASAQDALAPLGLDSIDDCDILRSGRTGAVLGHRVAAPSMVGTFLQAFRFGHVRELDRVLGETLCPRVADERRPRRGANWSAMST